jgi:hypothetical protein
MREKYYTPDISEFRVGFEYQLCTGNVVPTQDDEDWVDFTFGNNDIYEFDNEGWVLSVKAYLEMNRIRVKHLDKEDIESLGWVYDEKDKTSYLGLVYRISIEEGFNCFKESALEHGESNIDTVIITSWTNGGYSDDKRISQYVIKNKNELKTLMRFSRIFHNDSKEM